MQLGSHDSHNVNAGHAGDGEDVSNAANATQLRSASSAAFPEPARSLGTLISHNYNYDRDVTVTNAARPIRRRNMAGAVIERLALTVLSPFPAFRAH